jgi:myo-inositol 2-dehydrogenase / D-chiro-inositol 1-dehydrogenase
VISQSSLPHFRLVKEFIKNGGIGKLESVKIGLQLDSLTKSVQNYLDIAAIVAGTQFKGPIKIEMTALQSDFIAKAEFENGITMLAGNNYSDGIRYEGTDGWIFVTADFRNTDASDKKLLYSAIRRTYINNDYQGNWLKNTLSASTTETGCKAYSIGILMNTAMKTGRKLSWDPEKEVFIDDFEAIPRL